MENLKIYNQLKTVPETVKKKITGGRLSGMTDIKPQWRIEKMTEVFGPCGFGWYYEVTKVDYTDGANDEKICTVNINLYYKQENEWSKPIPGCGGSMFVTLEKAGLHTSDEAEKMATTDALSVAMKMLGMGADVYMGYSDSKYPTKEETPKEQPKADERPWLSDKNYNILYDRILKGEKELYQKTLDAYKMKKEFASGLKDAFDSMNFNKEAVK